MIGYAECMVSIIVIALFLIFDIFISFLWLGGLSEQVNALENEVRKLKEHKDG